jgi:heat shock protein HslJ/membrane-bound inhibitor of C-type lysozyme
MMRFIPALLIFAALAAASDVQQAYTCPGGVSFEVRYTGAHAVVFVPERAPVVLPQTPSASGARYSDGYTVLWSKGGEAMLESGEVRAQSCKAASPVVISGLFTYLADAASFTVCGETRRLPVAMEQGYRELERVYLDQRSAPGAPLFVTVEGALEYRLPMEGTTPVWTLVVRRFVSAAPGGACPSAAIALGGRYTLSELGGAPVTSARPAFMEFDGQAKRAAGSGGCNRFTASFEQDGAALRFGAAASTRMACMGPGMDLEPRFFKTLEAVAGFRMEAGLLVLTDANGGVLARLRPGE